MRRFCFSLFISLSIFLIFAMPALAQDPVITITTGTVGEIIAWPLDWTASDPPENYAPCYGSQFSKSTYSELYDVLGCTYGCDGDYFYTPNCRDVFLLGGYTPDLVGDAGGEATHVLTIPEMPAHTHPPDSGFSLWTGYASGSYYRMSTGGGVWGTFSETGPAGGGQPHNNMPPYLTVNYLIRYQQDVITFTISSTPTPTPTATSTPTATPTGTVTIYLPQIDTYTHTLSSGKTYTVPLEVSFGQIFIGGGVIIAIAIIALRVLFGGVYRS